MDYPKLRLFQNKNLPPSIMLEILITLIYLKKTSSIVTNITLLLISKVGSFHYVQNSVLFYVRSTLLPLYSKLGFIQQQK